MRLLHVSTVPETLGFLRGQLRYFGERGFDVHVSSAPGPALDAVARDEGVLAHAVPLSRRPEPVRDLVCLFHLFRLIRSLEPDIVHAHTPKAGLLAMIAAALAGTPVRIFHLHGLVEGSARGLRRTVLRVATRLSCCCATQVLAVSPSVRSLVIGNRSCPPWKVSVPGSGSVNGVDAREAFNPDRQGRLECRARLGLDPGRYTIGYIGRLAREKGLDDLHSAWQQVRAAAPEAHLLVAGALDVRDPISASLLDAWRADPRVSLFAHTDDPAKYYACMDVFVLPTWREGLPTVALEAAAMQVPVIATSVTGCVDAVAHNVNGTLVPPRNPEALAAAIMAYRNSPEFAGSHGENGRKLVVKQYNPQAVWHSIDAVYSRAAALNRRRSVYDAVSRLVDVCLSGFALVCLSPLLLLLTVTVRVLVGNPAIFTQYRAGLHGRPFVIRKFRSMTDARDPDGRLLPDRQRLTMFGRILRATSLDELPQLWNVLCGEMALVGPRPLPVEYLERYSESQLRRLSVKPGITGWAQVNGRNGVDWETKFQLDEWYVNHRGLRTDLLVLARTVAAVLLPTGISYEGHASMPEFLGSTAPFQNGSPRPN